MKNVDIREFDAVGDSVTHNTITIQEAIAGKTHYFNYRSLVFYERQMAP